MQYKGYELQNTYEGCIIRDSKGQFITSMPSESEAREYVDDLDEDETIIKEEPTDWYKRFERYCANLRKVYPNGDGQFAALSEKTLQKFIRDFEGATDTKVIVEVRTMGGENFYFVTDVIKN